MKTVKIKKSFVIEGNCRIDAPFHLSDGVLSLRLMKNCPYPTTVLLEESEELFKGNIHKRIYVDNEEFGFPFFTASDMFKADLNSGKFISKKYSPYLEELKLKKDWIVITRSGTLGNVLYTNADFENKMGTDDLIRIKPAQNKVRAGFLFAYLKSKYGYALLTQSGYGGVVKHIEPEHIKNIPIPIFPEPKQQEIHHLIVEAADLRVEANRITTDFVAQINTLLSIEFGEIKKQQSCYVNNKEIQNLEKRFDASYNAGLGRIFYDKIVSNKHKKLADISEVFHPMLFGKKQLKGTANKGNALYKSSSMMKMKPVTDFWLSLRKIDSYSKLQVKEGWVLISRTGTVGNVVRISNSLNNIFIDDHMIRVKPKKEYSGLVFIYLKSFVGQKLIDFQKYGSVQEVINKNYIDRIPIPLSLFDDLILDELNNGVSEAYNKIDKAIYNESKAIQLIETEIDSWHN